MKALRRIVVIGALSVGLLALGGPALADPCLVVYPNAPCVYHYDPAEYYAVGPGHPLYAPAYDRGGQVLLTAGTSEIDQSVYQPAELAGFVADGTDQGYYFEGSSFDLVIDGFSNVPMTFVNILVQFDKSQPTGCVPVITVDGAPISGMVYNAGDLVVQTPTPTGHNYSDVMVHHVAWTGCQGLHVWAFSDPNHDGTRTGRECFTAYSHDLTVPAQSGTWSVVKALYR